VGVVLGWAVSYSSGRHLGGGGLGGLVVRAPGRLLAREPCFVGVPFVYWLSGGFLGGCGLDVALGY